MSDVIVVGAGPAGSCAALHLARRGLDVLLLDRRPFPREKVCGDALIADAQRALDRAGLLERVRAAAHACEGLSVFSPSRLEVRLGGSFLTLRRSALDDLLARAAVEAGARFEAARVVRVDEPRSSVVLEDGSERRARVVLVATGADVGLLADLGLAVERRGGAAAVRCYIESAAGPEHLVISYDRSLLPGYAWIFPMGGGVYNVGCGVFFRGARRREPPLKSMLERFLAAFPPARELAAGATSRTALRGAPLRCGLRGGAYGRGSVLAVGEAIGTTFPATGEGIGKALETGEIAAEIAVRAVAGGDRTALAEFPARIEALRPRYRGYVSAERWLGWPTVGDFIARRAHRSGRLRAALQGILDESVDPRAVFSVRGLVRALTR